MLSGFQRNQLEHIEKELSSIWGTLKREADNVRGEPEAVADLLALAGKLNSAIGAIHSVSHNTKPHFELIDLTAPIDMSDMTEQELKGLKSRLYQASGDIRSACYTIAKYLGRKLSPPYGPKYKWLHGNVDMARIPPNIQADLIIYRDDYGGYLTVTFKGKQVLSTHRTAKLFIPGEWVQVILDHEKQACEVEREKELEFRNSSLQRLLNEMSLP